ncbi:MAG: hypothetical protein Q9171_007446 [Xanthocarpia ochracea]
MIYREITLPPVDDAEMKRLYHKGWETETNDKEVEKLRQYHTTKLLLINKQIKAEACKLLSEEGYYQSFVPSYYVYSGYSDSVYTGCPDLEHPLKDLPPFELLSTVRNIQLTLPAAWVSTKLLDHQDRYIGLFAKLLSVPCNDLASESPQLKNLTVYLPCNRCAENHGFMAGYRRPAHLQCFHADKVAALLAPIRRLRARSIRFVLDCRSHVFAELQPVFQDIAAIVQSSEPIEPLTSRQNEWFELRLEAKRRGFYEEVSGELTCAWYDIGDRYLIWPYSPGTGDTYQFHLKRARQRLEEFEIHIPSAPTYTPNVDQKIDIVTLNNYRRNGTILSRFTTEHGGIRFTVRKPLANGLSLGDTEEVDVDLAEIYDYVTPAELERYEHRELELEVEREANRPKVGRPRNSPPGFSVSTEVMGQEIKIKRPLGRPRKRPLTSGQNTRRGLAQPIHQPRTAFAGVYIPSPVKASQTSSTKASRPTSVSTSESASRGFSQTDPCDNSSASGREGLSETQDTGTNVDQLTWSNARRVISAPQPSSSRGANRPSYSMVKAALSESGTEDDLPQSPSEDELNFLIPTAQQRRFAAVVEVAESVSGEVKDPIVISSSSSSQEDGDIGSGPRKLNEDTDMLSNNFEPADSYNQDRLLQQFQASNTRRLRSRSPIFANSTRSVLSPAPQQPNPPVKIEGRTSHQHVEVAHSDSAHLQKTPTQSRHIRKSMTPHFPSTGQSKRKTIEPRVRGGLMDGSVGTPTKRPRRRHGPVMPADNYALNDRHQISSLLNNEVNLSMMAASANEITLGSPETLSSGSDRQSGGLQSLPTRNISSTDNRDITLGTPIASSSDETGYDDDIAQEPSIAGQRTGKSLSGSTSGTLSGWFGGMPWR